MPYDANGQWVDEPVHNSGMGNEGQSTWNAQTNSYAQPPATNATGGGLVDSTTPTNAQPPGLVDSTAPPPAAPAAYTPETLNGMVGYRMANGGWVPGDHPLATNVGAPSLNPNGGQPTPGATPAAAPAATPGASAGSAPPPTPYTSTPDMQAMQRQAIIDQITQAQLPVSIDDANIKAQLDPYAAAQERTRRNSENEAAERASAQGMGSSGALDLARRSAQERAGQATGLRGSELVGQELQTKRDTLKNYLDLNARTIDADQARMLQKQLADMDAQIRREGMTLQGQLGNRELDVRTDLGNKGLSNDIMRILTQRQQFGQDLGFRIGNAEAGYNRDALLALINNGG